jgi:glycyl-tRNA synthetase beta chain
VDREFFLEIGCEELPASWLTPLTRQLAERITARLKELRLDAGVPVETFSTPRRLAARVSRIAERQTDLDETVNGPPVSAAFGADGQPTPAAVGFARKYGVEVADLVRIKTPKGEYLAYTRHQRGKPAVDVLPDVTAGALRDLSFPKQMRWDAWLDDGKGELLFGRPIRWIVCLYGGRVVSFTIHRSQLAQNSRVDEVRSGAVTHGHRFLATSGRAGRSIKVKGFDDYRHRLAEHFVIIDRDERQSRIGRELDTHARRLQARVSPAAAHAALLQEVPDLVEYPSVVAGSFDREFLTLPEEVLTTTMIHHQHFFPLVDHAGRLLPSFLAVINIVPDDPRPIARNAERVLTARLRDARFFWESDRRVPLEGRLDRLSTVLFHKAVGSYRQKAERIEQLAGWIATVALGRPDAAAHARTAARLAKADLATDMVREFTELQGTMGGIYARAEGFPEPVWKAIYYHYLPAGIEPAAPPTRADLGTGAVSWAAVSLADKLDTLVGLFRAGERPTGSRDPFALRRQAHGIFKMLVDLPEVAGLEARPSIGELVDATSRGVPGFSPGSAEPEDTALRDFLLERLRYVLEQRGFDVRNVRAVTPAGAVGTIRPLDALRKLRVLPEFTGSPEFRQLAIAFKRVKNIARELPDAEFDKAERDVPDLRGALNEPAELAVFDAIEQRRAAIEGAVVSGASFRDALVAAAGFGPPVDRFFTDVFVMVDDPQVKQARLRLMKRLERLILQIADISEIVAE